MAGLNGDSSIQFLEMVSQGDGQKLWGPQGAETVGRAMLVFFDSAGNQTGRFVAPSNPGSGANTVLFATQRRYLRACETLARVRRLRLPSMQINIGKKQLNVA